MKKVGIIGAMDVEIDILRKVLKDNGSINEINSDSLTFYEGSIDGIPVVVVRSGIGKVNAALCAQKLILQFNVTHVINTGIAGSMASGLGIFDMVVSTDAVYHDMDATAFGYKPTEVPQMKDSDFKASEELIELAEKAFVDSPASKEHKMIRGRIATGDQFISDKQKKQYIMKVANPACVEMEGAAIAHACFLSNIPFVVLRCMSDMADETYEQTYKFDGKEAAEEVATVVINMIKKMKSI